MSIVNSHNEWDTLKEVIVGSGFPETLPDDISFKLFFHDNIFGHKNSNYSNRWKYNQRILDEHIEDIEGFKKILIDNNVKVLTPKIPNKLITTKTLCWTSTNYPPLNVRDLTMIVGDSIIETPVSARWRQFENDYLKHIYLDYFKNGSKWVSAPRPLATDNSYDFSRVEKKDKAMDYYTQLKTSFTHPLDCGVEIMFDAANCMRLGDKILFNAPSQHEKLGAKWLQDTLGTSYNVWLCEITDHHIDSVFLPLKPGLALITLDIIDRLPKPLQSWDFIKMPEHLNTSYSYSDEVFLASEKIYCNVLSISKDKLICMPEYYDLLSSKLKPYNIEVIPSRLRYSRAFGGGHHCITLDTVRDSKLESYF